MGIEITDKKILQLGDIIEFHSWYVDEMLFGIIVEQNPEDDYDGYNLKIWRPRSAGYSILGSGVDHITLIEKIEDVADYKRDELIDFINDANADHVYMKNNIKLEDR